MPDPMPERISRAQLTDACRLLGLDGSNVLRVDMTPFSVRVDFRPPEYPGAEAHVIIPVVGGCICHDVTGFGEIPGSRTIKGRDHRCGMHEEES